MEPTSQLEFSLVVTLVERTNAADVDRNNASQIALFSDDGRVVNVNGCTVCRTDRGLPRLPLHLHASKAWKAENWSPALAGRKPGGLSVEQLCCESGTKILPLSLYALVLRDVQKRVKAKVAQCLTEVS